MCRYQGYLAAHLEHLAECLLAVGRAGEATAAITEAVLLFMYTTAPRRSYRLLFGLY